MNSQEILLRQPHSEFAHRRWPATPEQLKPIRADVRHWLGPLELTDDAQHDLLLAVSEAASNAIEHAHPTTSRHAVVELTFWTDNHAVWIEIVDHGEWKAPSTNRGSRGRGIPMMQRLVESVMIHYDTRGTRVLLRHPLPGAARELSSDCRQPVRLQDS